MKLLIIWLISFGFIFGCGLVPFIIVCLGLKGLHFTTLLIPFSVVALFKTSRATAIVGDILLALFRIY